MTAPRPDGTCLRQAHALATPARSVATDFPTPARSCAIALACALMALSAAPQRALAQTPEAVISRPLQVSLPAQPLALTIDALARQSGVGIGLDASLAAGKTAPAIQGSMTLGQALERALADSGLTATANAAGVSIRRRLDTATTLPAVTVTGSAVNGPSDLPAPHAGGQVARGAQLGLLGNADIMDTPFNVTSYTAKTVEDQQARSIADLLGRNDPSVRVTGGEGGDTDTLRIRGFDVPMEDSIFNGLPGLLSFYRSTAEFAERVEVLKGPSAMLGGMSPSGATGGTINVVPKRAGDQALTRLTTSYLSDSRFGLHADVGRRFGQNNEWGIRVNGLFRSGDTARDLQRQNHRMGSVALDYRGERVRASVDYLYQSMRDNASRTALTVGAATAGISLRPPSGSTNFSQPWAFVESGNRALMGRVEVDMTPSVTAYAAAGRSTGWFDGKGPGNIALTSAAGDTRGSAAATAFHLDTTSAEIGLRGTLETGAVKHQWAVSATSLERETSYGFSASAGPVLSNIYNPIYYPEPAGIQPVPASLASRTRLPSIGIADTMSFAQDRVRLSLGLRHQTVKATNFDTVSGASTSDYDKSATTPFAGLVVKAWNGGAVYANYIEGLAQGDVAPIGTVNAGEILAPYKSKQVEVGVKQEWNGVTGTLSAFRIAKPSGLVDPASNRYAPSGEQRHRGLEANVFGQVTRGVRVLGGVAWIDAEMSETQNPATLGKRPVGVPRFTANLGTEWDLPGVPGLTLTAAAIHTGASYVDGTNATRIAGWTRADLGARFATRIADRRVVFRAVIENAFDKNYWSVGTWNSLQLGMSRTFAVSASMDF